MNSRAHEPESAKAPRWIWLALACLLLAWTAIAFASLRQKSATIDEYGYLASAKHLVDSFDPRYSEWHAPLVNYLLGVPLLGAEIAPEPPLPPKVRYWFWNRAEEFERTNAARYHDLLVRARLASLALSLALGVLVFFWARAIAPPAARGSAGVLACGLTLFHPELLAHGQLATLDVGVTFFVLLALFALHRYVRAPSTGRAMAFGVALGLAQAAKFTAILVAPFAVLVFAACIARPALRRAVGGWRLASHLALAFALALFVLHAVYGFAEPWTSFGALELESERMLSWQRALPSFAGLPLPRAYVQAFDLQLLDQQGQYRCYLEGTTIQGGRLDYFAILFLRKTPVAGLLLALAALLAYAFAFFSRRSERRLGDTCMLLLPALLVVAGFSCSQKQIGLRMAMPAIPLFAIWLAASSPLLTWSRNSARASFGLAALSAVGVLSAHPHYLSYFNAVSGGPEQGYRHALGSNYDWGQDLIALREWMEREGLAEIELFSYGRVDPATYGIRYHVPIPAPKPGATHLAVSASFYGMSYPVNDHGRRLDVDVSAQRRAIFENPSLELVARPTPAWFVFRLRTP